jgi:sugar phosphate isomerase/epimerase
MTSFNDSKMSEIKSTHCFPLSIATSSLNPFPARSKPPYDLVSKLQAISHAGFQAIELAFPDFLSFAAQHFSREIADHDWENLCIVAKEVRGQCEDLGLEIMMLQPFGNFEGWNIETVEGKKKREEAFERAKGWIRIMKELHTNMLQVCVTAKQ